MNAYAEQFAALAKVNFDAQVRYLNALSVKALESVEQVIDLNLSATKASFEESAELTKQFLAVKDPREALALAASQTQPAVNKAVAYSRHLADIASGAHAEFSQATEEQIAESSRNVIALVDDFARNAPAGSENTIALVKTAVGNASASYEQFSKSTKQAINAIETNVAAVADRFAKTAQKQAGRASKAA